MTPRTVTATVTELVLTPPLKPCPPIPVGTKLALIKAEPMPVAFYRYLYDQVGRNWMWVDRHGCDDEALAAMIGKEGIEITVLYGGGTPAGYFELDFSRHPRVDLAYFGLVPDWCGRGIGRWLLGCAIDEAFSREAAQMTVSTCTLDDPRALIMYQKCGFRPIGQRLREFPLRDGFQLPEHFAARMR